MNQPWSTLHTTPRSENQCCHHVQFDPRPYAVHPDVLQWLLQCFTTGQPDDEYTARHVMGIREKMRIYTCVPENYNGSADRSSLDCYLCVADELRQKGVYGVNLHVPGTYFRHEPLGSQERRLPNPVAENYLLHRGWRWQYWPHRIGFLMPSTNENRFGTWIHAAWGYQTTCREHGKRHHVLILPSPDSYQRWIEKRQRWSSLRKRRSSRRKRRRAQRETQSGAK